MQLPVASSDAHIHAKQRAQRLIQAGRLAEARQLLEAVRAAGDADIHGLLGIVCGMQGDNDAAQMEFQRAVAARPNDCRLRNNYGCALRLLGKHHQAEAQFREAVRLSPGYVGAQVNLGCALIDTKKFVEAEAVLRAVLKETPGHAEALNNLGTALRQRGLSAEAMRCYEQAVRLRPDYPDALANLGMSWLFENRTDQAEVFLRQTLTYAPGHVGALYYLGFLLYKQGALADAEHCFRHIIELQPHHENAAYFLSIIGARDAPPRSPANYVEDLFDGYADKFEEHLVGTLKYSAPDVMNRLVRQALDNCGRALDILDLGCGTGLCASRFSDLARSLVGVDLSDRMLAKARGLGIYSDLVHGDIVSFLENRDAASCDLVLAGDVFVYIGDLAQVFAASARILRAGGLLSFSIERSDDDSPYTLRASGRYGQRPDYILGLASATGLHVRSVEDFVLREEFGKGIAGQVYVLARVSDDS